MSKETINLYNYFHNGDILFARMVTNLLKTKFNVKFHHNLTPPLFQDMPEVEEFSNIPSEFNSPDHFLDSLQFNAINTWLGQGGMRYLNRVNAGCSFENHMELAKEICNNFGIVIHDIEEHLPTVNFSNLPKFELINSEMLSYKEKFRKIVLVSNGDVHSSQSHNFDFYPLIVQLSSDFPDVLFLCTKSINCINNNMINVDTITQIIPDLLYISQISTFCDVIIGRASGPYCFSQIKENLLDRNKTFIAFSYNANEGKFYSKLKANFVWSNNFDYNDMRNIIKNNLIN
jgi:hypothetical protein